MPDFNNLFGVHENALKLQSYRSELLASNLANADTPNYKARDIDFNAVLKQQMDGGQPSNSGVGLKTTQKGHMEGGGGNSMALDTQYRVPNQASIDGNTVDTQVEKAKVMENSIRYQATLQFINGRISSLTKAISGQ